MLLEVGAMCEVFPHSQLAIGVSLLRWNALLPVAGYVLQREREKSQLFAGNFNLPNGCK